MSTWACPPLTSGSPVVRMAPKGRIDSGRRPRPARSRVRQQPESRSGVHYVWSSHRTNCTTAVSPRSGLCRIMLRAPPPTRSSTSSSSRSGRPARARDCRHRTDTRGGARRHAGFRWLVPGRHASWAFEAPACMTPGAGRPRPGPRPGAINQRPAKVDFRPRLTARGQSHVPVVGSAKSTGVVWPATTFTLVLTPGRQPSSDARTVSGLLRLSSHSAYRPSTSVRNV